MPTITRYFIKAAMLYFVVGLLMAFLLSIKTYVTLPDAVLLLNPTYLHVLVMGWITQLIFGVAYWMFPKYSKDTPRGDERIGWLIFICFNLGLITRIIGEPFSVRWLLPVSAVLQFVGVWFFILAVWPRVKER